MAKAILDISIEQGYPYLFVLNMDDSDGNDLENDYTCWFECDSIGKLQFGVDIDKYSLTISKEDTGRLDTNLEEYVVYTVKTSDGTYDKLLSGRMHIDAKVRT